MRRAAFFTFLLLISLPASAATVQEAKMRPADGANGDFFGGSVSIDGRWAAVGASGNDEKGPGAGAVYVYRIDGTGRWVFDAKLTASDGQDGDAFGASVSISGGVVAIGATGDDDDGTFAGAAYVFTRSASGWTQQAKLHSSTPNAYGVFGGAVALRGGTLAVGSRGDDGRAYHAGAVFVFEALGAAWSEQAKLTALDGGLGDQLGTFIGVSGDSIVASAPADGPGSAYVFVRGGTVWSQQAKLVASDAASGDAFGNLSASISGDSVVVGAEGDDGASPDTGAAYVFTRTAGVWSEQAKLVASDPQQGTGFGRTAVVQVDRILVGAYFRPRFVDRGSVYVFDRTGSSWNQSAIIIPSDPRGHMFGMALGMSGDGAIVGAPLDGGAGPPQTGAAYLFGCGEDGADALASTPLAGTVSGLVHGTVEPLLESVPAGADAVHTVSCDVLAPAERAAGQ